MAIRFSSLLNGTCNRRRRRARLMVEELEPRNLPSTLAAPFTPAEIQQAYGFSQSNLTGKGETIAIVDAYNDPDIQSDLATFDREFGLPAASLSVVEQEIGRSLPATNSSWDLEISLDVEWAHVIAPQANILLVEANNSSTTNLLSAVQYAAANANVVSMSWGTSEFSGEQAYDSIFSAYPNVTFVASSGDTGTVSWPAVSPDVLSVGGSSLTINSNGSYGGETAWNNSYGSSGGGTSQYEPAPSYQQGITGSSFRTTPDVAYNADPNTGVYIYDSVRYEGYSGWYEMGGTSAGAPQWAGLIALADQGRAANGLAPLGSVQTLTALYSLYNTSAYAQDFHDITTGSNAGGYSAGVGYDRVTGLGSPVANNLVSYLAGYNPTANSQVQSEGTTHSPSSPPSKPANHHDTGIAVSSPASNIDSVPTIAPSSLTVTAPAFLGTLPATAGTTAAGVSTSILPVGTAALPSSNGVEARSTGTGGNRSDDILENGPATQAAPVPLPAPELLPAPKPAPANPDPVQSAVPAQPQEEATPADTLGAMGAAAIIEIGQEMQWRGWYPSEPPTIEMAVLGAALTGWWGIASDEAKKRSNSPCTATRRKG